ncbi:ABC transporter ATP-binding protein [Nonomuraea soli]|uniref:ATP-binding cassette subfamily B protein/ATP-binding cassette subfamily C protein n=1 Tax=Nonomuraea soli TaxID=1032476 RepID=A0A7W0CMW6_9ACTN|nr:ATP-binding cassette domain-containing protein [Nonomuraea soli]MBA2893942.1 ATP-binding cassette subfamily B protein/ATP-binding cassette subfamily C protein [Nonomuraea soli]
MAEEPLDLGEVTFSDWHAHTGTLTGLRFLTMARRLPALIRHAMRLAWQASPRDTTVTIGLNLVSGVFTAFGLLATTGVLDALFSQGPTPDRVRAALPSLALVAAAAALRASTQALAGWAQSRLSPQISRLAEGRLYDLTAQVELVAFDDPEFHDALERARARGADNAHAVVSTAINVVTALVSLTAVAGVLGVLHPVLLPLLLLAVLPDAWAAVRTAKMRYAANFAVIPAMRRKWIIADLMGGRHPAAEARSFTMRGFLTRMYDAVARAEQDVMLDLARRRTVVQLIGQGLGGLGTGMVYAALGVMLWLGTIPLAIAGTAVLAIRQGQNSLENLMYATNRLYEEGLYFTDFLDFCAAAEKRLPRSRSQLAPREFATIAAEDVHFTYPGSDSPALRGVSIEINRGEVIAFVGENGSGKTTLAKILSGLYEPGVGRVTWDDIDVAQVEPEQLRSHIAVIAQDHTRWPLTARYNITMGTDKGQEQLEAAARVAGADEVVADLPYGYRTLLDRRFKDGQELSGGQWQRIAVARGFHRDATLLICDEPTAALDARAEHALFERIRTHADGRTVLLITHRLASVRYADRIYVLDRGKVVEQGSHRQLMVLDGLYAELYNLQASAYQAGV